MSRKTAVLKLFKIEFGKNFQTSLSKIEYLKRLNIDISERKIKRMQKLNESEIILSSPAVYKNIREFKVDSDDVKYYLGERAPKTELQNFLANRKKVEKEIEEEIEEEAIKEVEQPQAPQKKKRQSFKVKFN